jgi:PAS domain S-box-containing protein
MIASSKLKNSRRPKEAPEPNPSRKHNSLKKMGASMPPAADECRHAVQFYESDAFLAEQVSEYIATGLEAGGSGIVIGTPEHRQAIEEILIRRNVDLDAVKAERRYFALDAADTLSRFMVDGVVDEKRFREVVGELIARVSRRGLKLRAFGEMVALLWTDRNRQAALRLEELWSALSREHFFSILCAYPMSGFGDASSAEAFNRVCATHSSVLPAEPAPAYSPAEKQIPATVEALETRNRALEDESSRRKYIDSRGRLLAAIVESSDDAIISKDLNGIIMSWNAGAQRMFGYAADEIIGKSVTTLMPADRQKEEPNILARLRRGERTEHYETIRRRKDGTELEVSLTVSPIKDASGVVVGASKIARDITERKRAELQQQVLYELTSAVNRAAALPEIYKVAIDAICRCQSTKRAALLLYGPDGVMRFKEWRNLSDEYRKAVEGHSPWRRDETDAQPVGIDDVSFAALEDSLREVVLREGIQSLVFLPVTYEGRLLGKCMIYYDTPHHFTPEELRPVETIIAQVAFAIERQKTSENLERMVNERTASLREAIGQMEEFSYSVSHDLRAPVRAMQCYAEVLMEDYGTQLDAKAQKYLERIIQSGGRMDRLIQDILTYSRMSRREVKLQFVSLDRLTREIVRQHFDMSSGSADISVEGKLADVVGHEPSLSQAISNLIHNAVKFVPAQTRPKVRLHAERHNGEVRLWVEDNGIGIKPEYQHRLFNVFERVHPEKNYEGTGIGLAIVRKAAERMGGKAGVESDGIHGSRFWIQLPAAENV